MNVNHTAIVQAVAAQAPVDARSPQTQLDFVLRVLAALPVEADDAGKMVHAGLLLKPTGDNIAPYGGLNVSTSRVCYPDGTLYKIVSDAGPGGTNGPQWVENGHIDPSNYVRYDGALAPVAPAPPKPAAAAITPYDEQQVVAFAIDVAALLHGDSGRVGVNCARMQFDAVTMGYALAREKHVAELRAELGLN